MNKVKIVKIACAILSFICVFGIATFIFILTEQDQLTYSLQVSAKQVTEKEYTVKSLSLAPGDEVEYKLDLQCDLTGIYHVELAFTQTKDNGLDEFVWVEVSSSNKVLKQKLLKDVFAEKSIKFDCVLLEGNNQTVKIKYKMNEETGNEAMGTSTEFKLKVVVAISDN